MPQADPSSSRTLTADHAALLCAERGVKFTPLRRLALEALLDCDNPLGAYELIRALQQRLGKRVDPPTAYRALEFLQQQGFVTRIETRNAFLPIAHTGAPAIRAFFLCNDCGATLEMDLSDLEAEFASRATRLGFQVGRRVVELQGRCASCQDTFADTPDSAARGEHL
ncbi:transcriptional repressor [Paracoccus benzoatiresistens]|uniref:Transcriptional repressor n=1 Tax=Paracoccus benzoatiresistens TaxID=2997341 RepID=A0ABT4J706_9RHOB|nr:transcriptional repressor [Paracoccus sp. EF6]MCZ0962450.1 transcriptional repressor [Paracoccus sp. EF6]